MDFLLSGNHLPAVVVVVVKAIAGLSTDPMVVVAAMAAECPKGWALPPKLALEKRCCVLEFVPKSITGVPLREMDGVVPRRPLGELVCSQTLPKASFK